MYTVKLDKINISCTFLAEENTSARKRYLKSKFLHKTFTTPLKNIQEMFLLYYVYYYIIYYVSFKNNLSLKITQK